MYGEAEGADAKLENHKQEETLKGKKGRDST